MKKLALVALIGLFTFGGVSAQKIKYKDLYFLLNTKNYDQAEPLLKRFLQDDKEKDHPNANFQLAQIFDDKALKQDVLLETDQFITFADSAIIYYQKAQSLIDDKEVRKNDEYYQAYQRRDIRTGKFGIKLADIQFDIENKIKSLRERKVSIGRLKDYYSKSKAAYKAANKSFLSLKEQYPTEKQLLLRMNEETNDAFDQIIADYTRSVENFESYKTTLSTVGKTNYAQQLDEKQILDYEHDGVSVADMTKNSVEFWDYAQWVENTKTTHNEQILPVLKQLIAFGEKLDELNQKILTDSISVKSDIPTVAGTMIFQNLKVYDTNPLPAGIFNYKMTELEYYSQVMENLEYSDSSNVAYKLDVVSHQLNLLNKMDSTIAQVASMDLEEEGKNYQVMIDATFGGQEGLEKYISGKEDFVKERKNAQEQELTTLVDRSRWLLTENDSIPLFIPESPAKYRPVAIDSLLTVGVCVEEDILKGYMANINGSLTPDVLVQFDLNSEFITDKNYESVKSKTLVTQVENESIYFLMLYVLLPEQENYTATIARISASDLEWSKNLTLQATPLQMTYAADLDELVIEYDLASYTGEQELSGKLLLDKQGNELKP